MIPCGLIRKLRLRDIKYPVEELRGKSKESVIPKSGFLPTAYFLSVHAPSYHKGSNQATQLLWIPPSPSSPSYLKSKLSIITSPVKPFLTS